MNKILRIVAPILVIALSLGVVKALEATKPVAKTKEHVDYTLSLYVERAQRQDISVKVNAQGEVTARTQVNLFPQVSGAIVSINPKFIEGGQLAANEVLLAIDDTDYRLDIINAQAAVAAAELNVQQNLADADVARKQLSGDDHSPLALKQPHIAEARARLASAKASLEQAQVALDRTKLRLPYASLIRSKEVGTGQFVTSGTLLGKAFAIDDVEVLLPLSDIQLTSLGLPLGFNDNNGPEVTINAHVGGKTRQWQGRLIRIDAAIDPQTRLIYSYVKVENPYQIQQHDAQMPLAIGLYVDTQITGKKLTQAVVIPRAALRGADQVYVIKDDVFSIRKVEVAHQDSEVVVVSAGVAVDEQVVIAPVRAPKEGMKVKAIYRLGTAKLAKAKP